MTSLSACDLRRMLDYCPETGALTWKPRPVEMFKTARDWKAWSTRFAGMPAFAAPDSRGYLQGKILGKVRLAHRIAWALFHGEWPVDQIDHINGNRADNRISNLRVVTNAENARNQKRRGDSTSGATGVYLHKQRGKWGAHITVDGRKKHIGLFQDFSSAVSARKAAEVERGFHLNHGRTE